MTIRVFYFLIIILFAVSEVYSQTAKGAVLIGVHQSIIPTKNNSLSFVLSPQVGYFLKKKLLLGLTTPPPNSSNTLPGIFVPPNGFIKNKGLISPFIRHYLFDDASIQFFLQQSIDIYQLKSNIKELETYSDKINIGTTFNLGLVYFIDTSTTLEFCYSRPLLRGSFDAFPISKLPYLKFGLNYMLKKRNKKEASKGVL